jgi:hypothetical protein
MIFVDAAECTLRAGTKNPPLTAEDAKDAEESRLHYTFIDNGSDFEPLLISAWITSASFASSAVSVIVYTVSMTGTA